MPTVNVHEAKANLSRLLAQVEAGEDVIIARRGRPVARLVFYNPRVKRQPDILKGKVVVPDNFFGPLPEKKLQACLVLVSRDEVFDQYGVIRVW